MRPDDDDFAAIVIAQEFQLIDGTGATVADFTSSGGIGGTVIPVGSPDLRFDHNATEHSDIGWTRNPVGAGNTVALSGPNGNPFIALAGNPSIQTASIRAVTTDPLGNPNSLTIGAAASGISMTATGDGGEISLSSTTDMTLSAGGALLLNPDAAGGLFINGRVAFVCVGSGIVSPAANYVMTGAPAQVTGSSVAIDMLIGDLLIVNGSVDCFWNANATAVVIPAVGGTNIGGAAVGTQTVAGARISLPVVGRFVAPADGTYTLDLRAYCPSGAGGATSQGGGGTTAYTYQLFSNH